jgi:hypothetical protein
MARVACPVSPDCEQSWYAVDRDEEQGEYVLRCAAGHEIRRFFVLVPPPVPPRPEPSEHGVRPVAAPPG